MPKKYNPIKLHYAFLQIRNFYSRALKLLNFERDQKPETRF